MAPILRWNFFQNRTESFLGTNRLKFMRARNRTYCCCCCCCCCNCCCCCCCCSCCCWCCCCFCCCCCWCCPGSFIEPFRDLTNTKLVPGKMSEKLNKTKQISSKKKSLFCFQRFFELRQFWVSRFLLLRRFKSLTNFALGCLKKLWSGCLEQKRQTLEWPKAFFDSLVVFSLFPMNWSFEFWASSFKPWKVQAWCLLLTGLSFS